MTRPPFPRSLAGLRRTLLVVLALAIARIPAAPAPRAPEPGREIESYPSDWFGIQRAFPGTDVPQQRWTAALEQARVDRAAAALSTSDALLTWQPVGPTNIGGRVTAITGGPTGTPLYLGAANGGVFRSTDFGVTWLPVFDALGVPSIGALALQPGDPATVYVGTGEANTAIDNYDGSGLFRSRDSGANWESLGLAETRRIARVAIDPSDPRKLFVAAMGSQFSTGPDRGLYRSVDGGANWTRALFVNDSTGACDVVVNPVHPETVFCATWERVRRPQYRHAYGPGCGIWRSPDHGATWSRLAGGLPTPSDSVGRIALALAPSQPRTMYAQIMAKDGSGRGFYRSTDGGQSWIRRDVSGFTGSFGGFGWYFGDCVVAPNNPDRVYALGVPAQRSTNGGSTFNSVANTLHPDQHALFLPAQRPDRMFLGNDGGLFWSADTGVTWTQAAGLPITQFYAGAIDPSNPLRILGGAQDNGTVMDTTGAPGAWRPIYGGDGFWCLVDPVNPLVTFAEYQNASSGTGPQRSTDGGGGFSSPTGINGADRFNWSTPFVMDPSNHNVMLTASQRVYRSQNNGVSYSIISPDLTTNPVSSLVYGTITTLAISAADVNFYLAGTDDGRVWRSEDAGGSWFEITAGLPLRWVTRVVADPVQRNTIYVTLSGFVADEHAAHVYRSTNRGSTWVEIDGNLPDAPVNDLIVDPADNRTLYAGTDVGVYATRNLGAGWFPLGQGMPLQVIHDLSLHAASRTLVAATHGRSQWKLDLSQLPVAVAAPPPAGIAFSKAWPNPARGTVRFTLATPSPAAFRVAVFDALGRRVRGLADRTFGAGRHELVWDGRDAAGRSLAAGVYYARAASGGWSAVRRIVRVE